MTPEEVRSRVVELGGPPLVGDSEAQHMEEKRIWSDVLTAIATGHPESQALAAEAVKTCDIKFERWYA